VAAGGAASVQQVGFLQGEELDDLPDAGAELVVVVAAQFTAGFDPGAEGSGGGGAVRLAVVMPGEEVAQEPRQRRVDIVPGAAQICQLRLYHFSLKCVPFRVFFPLCWLSNMYISKPLLCLYVFCS
jgi:hypothetical protein